MIFNIDEYVLDVDTEATNEYSKSHALCDCCYDRNFNLQARDVYPKLAEFLSQFGLMIERPDETSSDARNEEIFYHFVGYTVIGKIINAGKYEIDIFDENRVSSVVFNNWYIPNEQKADSLFTVTVYNMRLPWALNEPFPEKPTRRSMLTKFKSLFKRK